jgi:hypothetical protein
MKGVRAVRATLCVAGLSTILASCGSHPSSQQSRPVAEVPVAPPAPAIAQINRGIGPGETLWHVRSALNVAALSCRGKTYDAIATNYNRMLTLHRDALASAHADEEAAYRARYGANWARRQDTHLTQVYNFFANPTGAKPFCATALLVGAHVNQLDDAGLKAWSNGALVELERPFVTAGAYARR